MRALVQGGAIRVPEHAFTKWSQLGLQTLLGPEPGGFFVPYRQAGEAAPRAYPGLAPILASALPAFRDVISAMQTFGADLLRIAEGRAATLAERPARFGQDWFPRLDAAAAYTLVRQASPRRIIEIGSGHSTRFLAQAVVDGALATDFLCIDPQPRAPLSGLPVRHAIRLFGDQDAADAATLEPSDILFVDSSHIVMPGTDVDRLVLDVLPRLKAGVLVHFHDIFLPDPYPEEWAWRGYNEQIVVGALLQGGAFAPVFASHYAVAHTNLLAGSLIEGLPIGRSARESSLWLRKMVA